MSPGVLHQWVADTGEYWPLFQAAANGAQLLVCLGLAVCAFDQARRGDKADSLLWSCLVALLGVALGVLAKLLDSCYQGDPLAALQKMASRVRGSYALAVAENRYAGSVIMRSRSNEWIATWSSPEDQIVDLAFSDNGSELAVACVGFEESRIVSRVYILDVSSDAEEEKAVITFPEALPLAVDYKSDGSVHIICDTFVGVIESDLNAYTVGFSNSAYRYCFTDSETILLTTDLSAVSFTMTCIGRDGEKTDVQIKGGGNDIAVDSRGGIYLLEKTSIQRFNGDLQLLEEISVDSSIFSIAVLNNTLYLLSDSQLARLSDLEAARAAEMEG